MRQMSRFLLALLDHPVNTFFSHMSEVAAGSILHSV